MKFSFIIPVYNRPDELHELLLSLVEQSFTDFEIVIIEDGSAITSENVVSQFSDRLNIQYHFKKNEGPAIGRNYGATLAKGEFLIFTDSDCILPSDYLKTVINNIKPDAEVFGGPDKAHPDFNNTQKAISYTMTSTLTTGGARGSKNSVEKFYPRSFNMGIKRSVFQDLGGFPNTTMWPGEDMLLAIELNERDHKLQYIDEAFVYHKRRVSLSKFFKQIKNFGKVRMYITQVYPHTFKILHLLPLGFVIGLVSCLLLSIFSSYFLIPYIAYFLLVLIDSAIKNKSISVGILSVATTLSQFTAYSVGLLNGFFKINILNKPEFELNHSSLFPPQTKKGYLRS